LAGFANIKEMYLAK